jgi:hypothetical protein
MNDQITCKYCGRSYPLDRDHTNCDGCGNPMFHVLEVKPMPEPYGIVGFFYETFEALRIFVSGLWGAA